MNMAIVVNKLLAVLVILAQLFTLLLIILKFYPKYLRILTDYIAAKAVFLTLLISLTATIGSLLYSEVLGYEPCKLCWFERIFMFPQVVLFWIGIHRKDRYIADYGIILSALGALLAGYHSLLQFGLVPALSCSSLRLASCSQRFVWEFGYVTIPLMAFTAFSLMAVLLLFSKKTIKG